MFGLFSLVYGSLCFPKLIVGFELLKVEWLFVFVICVLIEI